MVAAAGDGEVPGIFDTSTGVSLRWLRGHSAEVNSIAFAPRGDVIATGSWDGTIKFWNSKSEDEDFSLDAQTEYLKGIAFSPDAEQLAAVGDDKKVRIWDLRNRRITQTLTGHTDRGHSVAFSPDGKHLVSGSADKTAILWRLK